MKFKFPLSSEGINITLSLARLNATLNWLIIYWFSVSLCFAECKIDNCEACFNRNFCTKCKEGLYSHSGRCYVSCPPGQRTVNETMECVGEWRFFPLSVYRMPTSKLNYHWQQLAGLCKLYLSPHFISHLCSGLERRSELLGLSLFILLLLVKNIVSWVRKK